MMNDEVQAQADEAPQAPQDQGPQAQGPQPQAPALKVYGLQMNIEREVKFTQAWVEDLVSALDVNAQGSILTTSQFKVVVDFRALAEKLRDKLARETLVLDPDRRTHETRLDGVVV